MERVEGQGLRSGNDESSALSFHLCSGRNISNLLLVVCYSFFLSFLHLPWGLESFPTVLYVAPKMLSKGGKTKLKKKQNKKKKHVPYPQRLLFPSTRNAQFKTRREKMILLTAVQFEIYHQQWPDLTEKKKTGTSQPITTLKWTQRTRYEHSFNFV